MHRPHVHILPLDFIGPHLEASHDTDQPGRPGMSPREYHDELHPGEVVTYTHLWDQERRP